MHLKLTVSNIFRKLVAVVSGDLGGRGICRRFAPQAGSNGNTVSATGCTDSGKVQPVTPPRKTAMKVYSLRFNVVIALLLLALGTAYSAHAGTFYCNATYGGVVDGFDSKTFNYFPTSPPSFNPVHSGEKQSAIFLPKGEEVTQEECIWLFSS